MPGQWVTDVNLRHGRKFASGKMSNKIRLVGEHIAAARKLLKMTQADLAAAAGVSEATIQKFEVGLHSPRPSTLKVLQDTLEQRGIEFTNGNSPGVKLDRGKAIVPS